MLKKHFKILSLSIIFNSFSLQSNSDDSAATATGLGIFLFTTTVLTSRARAQTQQKVEAQKNVTIKKIQFEPLFEPLYKQKLINHKAMQEIKDAKAIEKNRLNDFLKKNRFTSKIKALEMQTTYLDNQLTSTKNKNNAITTKYKEKITDLTNQCNHQEMQISAYSQNLIAIQNQAEQIKASGSKAKKTAANLLQEKIALEQKLTTTTQEKETAQQEALTTQRKLQATRNELAEVEKNSLVNQFRETAHQVTNSIIPTMYNSTATTFNNIFKRTDNSPKSTDNESTESIEEYEDGSIEGTVNGICRVGIEKIKREKQHYKKTDMLANIYQDAYQGVEDDLEMLARIQTTMSNHNELQDTSTNLTLEQNCAEVLRGKTRRDVDRIHGLSEDMKHELQTIARPILERFKNMAQTKEAMVDVLDGYQQLSAPIQHALDQALIAEAEGQETKILTITEMLRNHKTSKK